MSELRRFLEEEVDESTLNLYDSILDNMPENRRGRGRGRGRGSRNEFEVTYNELPYDRSMHHDPVEEEELRRLWEENQNRTNEYNRYNSNNEYNRYNSYDSTNRYNLSNSYDRTNYGGSNSYNTWPFPKIPGIPGLNNRSMTLVKGPSIGFKPFEKLEEKMEGMKEIKKKIEEGVFHMTERETRKAIESMRFPLGEKEYSLEEAEKIKREYKFEFSGEFSEVNKWDWLYALNNAKSTHHEPGRKDYEYAKIAYLFLTNPTFPIPGGTAKAWYCTNKKYKKIKRELEED